MFNKTRSFGPHGSSARRNKPFRYGGFNNANRSGGGNFRNARTPKRGKGLEGADINMFIKKAAGAADIEEYTPTHTFADFAIVDQLKRNISKKGYIIPTPIQDQAINPALEGRDVIGIASTGTGKTAAFLLPLINKVFQNRNERVLIVAPTRELALQIQQELQSFSQGMGIYSTLIIGGASMKRQVYEIRRNPHFVIGTPGRLKDLVNQRVLNLINFSSVVLDEVDLMVDIGFIQDIKFFVSLLSKQRQSLFFSATFNAKVNEILKDFVKDPVTISLKKQDTSENVEQDVVKVISHDKKIEQLHDILNQEGFDKVMVFGRTKHGVEKLHKQLTFRGFKVGAIHGNKKQGHRQRTLDSFKRNHINILLATDVASRGLDIDNVTHVINYDLPETYEDYIHRIGRTGRANRKGSALTFID